MMVATSYYSAAQFAESFQRLDDLRKSGQTCDISLLASNQKIKAHKIVLASASEYFKNAIYGLFLTESGKDELEFEEVQYEILSILVNYIYNGKIEINSENVYAVYNAADYCLMNILKELCLHFLQKNIDIDNCIKIWILANNSKHEKTIITAGNYIFSILPVVSNTKEFLSLSNEEILELFNLCPKDELFDSTITAALKWAAKEDNREETVIKILKDISHTRISDDYLEEFLSKNEFIQNSFVCNKWMNYIYSEKSKLNKLKHAEYKEKLKSKNKKLRLELAEFETKLKFRRNFFIGHPIIFMTQDVDCTFYRYRPYDSAFNLHNIIKNVKYHDCETYKDWIYVLGNPCCKRFAFDAPDTNLLETFFDHDHGKRWCATECNDSMHIFGGTSNLKKGTSIDLNTNKVTSFRLSDDRKKAGVAVNDRQIYICVGDETNSVERFDPREGRATNIGNMDFDIICQIPCSAGSLNNQIYCTNGIEYNMIDLRNTTTCVEINPPTENAKDKYLFSSYGKLYTISEKSIYEYNNTSQIWQNTASFQELSNVIKATSFE